MAINTRVAYIYDSNLALQKQGKLTLDSETGIYAFTEEEAQIQQGEVGTVQVVIILPNGTLTNGTPLITFKTKDGYGSSLLQMSTAENWQITVDGTTTTYQTLYITMSVVGWTYHAGRHALQASWLDSEGNLDKLPMVFYTVQDGINNFDEITADVYEEMSVAFDSVYEDFLDRLSNIELFNLNALGYNSLLTQEGAPLLKLYNLLGNATVSFDGTNLVLNRDSVDEEIMTVLNELGDLSNVLDTASTTDDILVYDTVDGRWEVTSKVNYLGTLIKSVTRTGTDLITITYYDDTTSTSITLAEFRTWLGNATTALAGLMSAQDKTNLNTLMALFDSDADAVVNTIAEILAIFENYPEGVDMVTALAAKEDISNKVTTFQATPTDIAYPSEKLVKDNLDLKIDKDYSSYTELTTLAEDDEIIVRDVANGLTKKAKMSALINYYGNSREYGVREVVGQSSPTLERVMRVNGLMTTGSATGLVANVGVDDSIVTNSFDSIAIFNRERVTISAGGVENVFVKAPKYYIKEEWTNESGTDYHYWWMCEYQLDSDYRLPLPFVTPEQTERDYAYIGAYEAYLDSNSKLRSISGVFPKVSYSRANFRTAARKLDTADSSSKYQITDVAEYVDLVQIPMMIEFATKNMQSVFTGASAMAYSDSHVATADGVASVGANTIIVANATGASFVVGQTIGIGTSRGGNQIASDRTITAIDVDTPSAGSTTITYDGAAVQALTGHYIYSLGWKTGRLDGALSSSALDTDNLGKYGFVWRGIENPYANIWKNVDGVKIVNNQAWICTDPSQYDDAASSGGDYAYPYQKLSYVNHNVNGYPTELGLDLRFPFAKFPTAIGAGSTTYYSDYYYQNTGDRTAFVGGYWDNGGSGGPFYWLLANSLGSASVYQGARLSYRP